MNSVFDNILVQASLVPATRTANANGTAVDTKGYSDGMLVVSAGDIDLASADETYVFTVEESDNGSTGWTAVSGISVAITADNQVKEARLADLNLARKRYLRAVLTVGGTTPSIPGEASIVLGRGASGAVGNA